MNGPGINQPRRLSQSEKPFSHGRGAYSGVTKAWGHVFEYLFKLRLTARLKKLVERLMGGAEWTDAPAKGGKAWSRSCTDQLEFFRPWTA